MMARNPVRRRIRTPFYWEFGINRHPAYTELNLGFFTVQWVARGEGSPLWYCWLHWN